MQPTFRINSRSVILLPILIIFILYACAPIEAQPPTETPFQAIATALAPTVAVESTVTGPSAESQFQTDLTVKESTGNSILTFSDFLEVELMRNAQVHIADIKQESGGSTEVTLNLAQGHIFVRLTETSTARVTVETADSIIKTLENGTEIVLCKAPDKLTCVAVKKGIAEIIGQGKQQVLNAGEASFILKDQPPSPAICVPNETFIVWEQNYRASADAATLSKMVADLPPEPCAATVLGRPADAQILYEEDFKNSSGSWPQGGIDNYSFGYTEPAEYYYVQILSPDDKYPAYLPNKPTFTDTNIDLVVFAQEAGSGDFHYGLVFRRAGNRYYAFTVSPRTKAWYVLKSSSSALEILKEGTEDSIQGLEDKDALRVTAKGSTFSFYINGRLVGEVSDLDYESGEVGLFVQTIDSPNALIHFDSIMLWNTRAPILNPTPLSREICFNNKDDDGDGQIDRADPECDRPGSTPTPEPPTAEPTTPVPPTTEVPPYP